jgi:tRNA(fMet)-specific endonuclease VapC
MFSYIVNGKSPAARAEYRRLAQDRNAVVCISCMTEAEVLYGLAKRTPSAARSAAIKGLLANLEILPWGSEEAAVYGRTRAKLEPKGITVAYMDFMIAVHAIAVGAVLVTRDSVFARIGDLYATVNWATDI